MLTDLVAVGLLSGLPALVLGVVGAATCFRAAWRPRGTTPEAPSRTRRILLVVLGAVVLGAAGAATLVSQEGSIVTVGAGDQRMEVSPGSAMAFVVQALALQTAKTEDERRAAARALVESVREHQPDREAARALVAEVLADLESPEAKAALQDALETGLPARPGVVARPDLAAAERDLRAAERRVDELEEEVEALRKRPGIVSGLRGIADDLGFGFGWGVVYFTALTAWWKGRTLGKRLFGCRVVRLDGRPLTWWNAFNRAGGYAASLATGLLGFAELIWDPNRQALHDRICRTVVLRDMMPPPPPQPSEGE